LEQACLSVFRKSWLDKEFVIEGLRKSKRFIPRQSLLEKIMSWISSVPLNSSVPSFEINDLQILQLFPESIL